MMSDKDKKTLLFFDGVRMIGGEGNSMSCQSDVIFVRLPTEQFAWKVETMDFLANNIALEVSCCTQLPSASITITSLLYNLIAQDKHEKTV